MSEYYRIVTYFNYNDIMPWEIGSYDHHHQKNWFHQIVSVSQKVSSQSLGTDVQPPDALTDPPDSSQPDVWEMTSGYVSFHSSRFCSEPVTVQWFMSCCHTFFKTTQMNTLLLRGFSFTAQKALWLHVLRKLWEAGDLTGWFTQKCWVINTIRLLLCSAKKVRLLGLSKRWQNWHFGVNYL